MAKATFFYHKNKLKKDKYTTEKAAISDIYEHSKKSYGYRRITLKLKEKGFDINHKTVMRLMQEMGLKGIQKSRKYRSYKGETGKILQNIIDRDFTATRPLEKMVTDITQINIGEHKLYLSALLDVYNGEISNYTLSEHPNLELVTSMINSFIQNNSITNTLILHSDQGWHYQHPTYQKILSDNHIIQSMSRKGNCYDNAMMESFFGRMKIEFVYSRKFKSKLEFSEELNKFIHYYNNERIKSRLKMSPIQYKKLFINNPK